MSEYDSDRSAGGIESARCDACARSFANGTSVQLTTPPPDTGDETYELCTDCHHGLRSPGLAIDQSTHESEGDSIGEGWTATQYGAVILTLVAWYFLVTVPFRFSSGFEFGLLFFGVVLAIWTASAVSRRLVGLKWFRVWSLVGR
ncbi:hypothetical protein [Halovivax gelatinilyticus]|uniref:hypothetical protein n=1 Tax=Halovivax gelatinilyticus TaxID=2961597 RepID=UPI0020CA8A9D|nr:hypothetical protein [Halovivax gelatinilyticus]